MQKLRCAPRTAVVSREKLDFGSSFVGAAEGFEGVGGLPGFLGKGVDGVEPLSQKGAEFVRPRDFVGRGRGGKKVDGFDEFFVHFYEVFVFFGSLLKAVA